MCYFLSYGTVPLLSYGISRASAIYEIFGIHPGPPSVFTVRTDEHLKRLSLSARVRSNYLNRYQAYMDFSDHGIDADLFIGKHGLLCEEFIESVFLVKDRI